MDDFKCNWEDCDEYQFEDYYYCKTHASRIELMNDMLRPFVR